MPVISRALYLSLGSLHLNFIIRPVQFLSYLCTLMQERLEQEKRERKKQKEKERKERLKKEGKLLTKSQREARARAEATLKLLQAQGK